MSNATMIYNGADRNNTTGPGTPRFANNDGPAIATAKIVCTDEAAAMMPEMNVSSADRSVEMFVACCCALSISLMPPICGVAPTPAIPTAPTRAAALFNRTRNTTMFVDLIFMLEHLV